MEDNNNDVNSMPTKKLAKKNIMKLESILDINSNNIWELDEFSIAEAWEREREEDETRTNTTQRSLPPQSSASTNSATSPFL